MEKIRLRGPKIEEHWQEIAALRIQVFREYPYLYQGSVDYERDYLRAYWESQNSLIVLLRDGGRAVGATTCMPLSEEHSDFLVPFHQAGLDPKDFFYLGESVLLPEYRGRGFGNVFFDEREAHAQSLGGFRFTCFCAVERPPHHPLKPVDYQPLHGFWQKRGYQHRPDLRCQFSWKDLDESEASYKPLSFWLRVCNRQPSSSLNNSK